MMQKKLGVFLKLESKVAPSLQKSITSATITVSPSLTPILMSDLFTPHASSTCWNLLSDSEYLAHSNKYIRKMFGQLAFPNQLLDVFMNEMDTSSLSFEQSVGSQLQPHAMCLSHFHEIFQNHS